MAYFNQNNQNTGTKGMNEKEDEQQQSSAVQLSGGTTNSVAPAAPVSSQQPKAASSGMGPGFQAYTKANQGGATNKLVNAAQTNVQNLGQKANNSINQATNKFAQKVDAGSLKNRYQAVQDVANAVNSARNLTAAPAPQAQSQMVTANNVPAAAQAARAGQANPADFQSPAAPVAPSIDQAQTDRFKEVINAKYQGPESLRQSGLYNPAQQNVTQANQAVQNSGTAQGREELLRQMYEKRGDYSRGLNKLDTSLLNSSKAGVQNLQNTAQNFKNITNDLSKAQINSSNLAQNRTNEIKNIQEQARNTFTQGKQDEEAATEARLAAVVKDWDKLPEHFRDIIRNKEANNKAATEANLNQVRGSDEYKQAQQALAAANGMPRGAAKNNAIAQAQAAISQLENNAVVGPNSVTLGDAEAQILGLQSGEGLYNLGADAIKTAAYDKEKLISRDEQARQAALSSLAGLDLSNRLDTNLKYRNADIAGTQSATDALDLAGTRAGINEAEKNFREQAKNTTLVGSGKKKNKTSGKTYYATERANMGDLLDKAGYDLDSELNQNLGNADILNNLSKANKSQVSGDPSGVAGAIDAYGGTINNLGDGQSLAQNAMDAYGSMTGLNAVTGALGLGSFGNAVGGLFGGGANSKASKAKAKQNAFKDLQNKVNSNLQASGFENRFDVSNNDVTNTRLNALQQLLANMDKTNNKG